MEKQKLVLVIDDDPTLRGLLAEFLEKFGFRVLLLENGNGVEALVRSARPDLLVLDVMMPGRDGVEVLKALRAFTTVPVVMLTARGEEMDRILGLELGADDYMAKPFNPRELLARIKAVLRRGGDAVQPPSRGEDGSLTVGGVRLNRGRQRLEYGTAREELSATEFRLLEVLLERPDRVLSRDQLMALVHERHYEVYDRSIDVHISKLRAKLKAVGAGEERIRTYWGSGYMFTGSDASAGEA